MRRVLGMLAIVTALAGCSGGSEGGGSMAAGGGSSAPESHELRLNVKEGDKFNYKMTMKMEQGGQQQTMTMDMATEVVKVEDGKVTSEASITGMSANGESLPDQMLSAIKSTKIIQVQDKTGKVLETKVEGGPPGMQDPSSGTTAVFPSQAVKVGDTWKGESEVEGKKLELDYKLLAFEDVKGKKAAKIEATADNVEDVKLEKPFTFWIELETGFPLKMEGAVTQQGMRADVMLERV